MIFSICIRLVQRTKRMQCNCYGQHLSNTTLISYLSQSLHRTVYGYRSTHVCQCYLTTQQLWCIQLDKQSFFVCLLGLRFYVPVNNFSVMSGRSHRFLGITSTFWEVNVSCSMVQHGDLSEDRTPDESDVLHCHRSSL